MNRRDTTHELLRQRRSQHLEGVREYMAQPSASQEHPEDVRQCAGYVADIYRRLGCRQVEIVETPGLPAVWAHYDAGAPKTLAVYSYFDTNTVGTGWDNDPYDTVLAPRPPFEEVVYGRGAASKGAVLAFINALSVIREVEGELPLNLMFVCEGEEFLGSPHVPYLIERFEASLSNADAVLWPGPCQTATGDAAFFLGNKGCLKIELECSSERWGRGPTGGAAHSSTQGVIDSPTWRLVNALSTLYDPETNTSRVPGFYDDLLPATEAEERLIDDLAERYAGREGAAVPGVPLGVTVPEFAGGVSGRDVFHRFCFQPTMNIDGLRAGFTGPGTTLWTLPDAAYCTIDHRLPLNMDPQSVLQKIRDHLDNMGYGDIGIRTLMSIGAQRLNVEDDIAQAALRVFESWNIEPVVWPRKGVSGPSGAFSQMLGLPVLGSTGVGFASGHSGPNEYLVTQASGAVGGLTELEQSFADLVYSYAAHPERAF